MRFLLDQSTAARLADYLRSQGHDAIRVGRECSAGLRDTEVLALAHRESRILITDDRDFGELVFQLRQPHMGVIYLRLGNEADLATKIGRLDNVLSRYHHQLDQFLVVSLRRVKVRNP
jgi:predicted nuclease of predicted toxin-antitoxin system